MDERASDVFWTLCRRGVMAGDQAVQALILMRAQVGWLPRLVELVHVDVVDRVLLH